MVLIQEDSQNQQQLRFLIADLMLHYNESVPNDQFLGEIFDLSAGVLGSTPTNLDSAWDTARQQFIDSNRGIPVRKVCSEEIYIALVDYHIYSQASEDYPTLNREELAAKILEKPYEYFVEVTSRSFPELQHNIQTDLEDFIDAANKGDEHAMRQNIAFMLLNARMPLVGNLDQNVLSALKAFIDTGVLTEEQVKEVVDLNGNEQIDFASVNYVNSEYEKTRVLNLLRAFDNILKNSPSANSEIHSELEGLMDMVSEVDRVKPGITPQYPPANNNAYAPLGRTVRTS